jgi:2-polyprenyl-3-methyl-5-hydroxy-6-metoxy-1,4-benzoquinol methylase
MCGLGMAEPRVGQNELDAFYASGAYWHASANSRAQLGHERNQCRHRVLRCIAYFARNGLVADIGAGHGAIAEWLDRLAGERVRRYDFIEPDEESCRSILGRRTRFPVKRMAQVSALDEGYSLVFLNHVLEHVADPVAFLGGVYERLLPGGVAYIETPHADHRFKDDVFPHTLFFTARAFRQLASQLDFEVLECDAFGAYPGTSAGIGLGSFRWLGAAFHLAARAGVAPLEQWLDDAIWRYRPAVDGMWLRCVLRRPVAGRAARDQQRSAAGMNAR